MSEQDTRNTTDFARTVADAKRDGLEAVIFWVESDER